VDSDNYEPNRLNLRDIFVKTISRHFKIAREVPLRGKLKKSVSQGLRV
jgi:hypothetical protein